MSRSCTAPSRSSSHARSSVATLPVARGANGQPPNPPTLASKRRIARFQAGDRVRVAGVARVVQVQAQLDLRGAPTAASDGTDRPRRGGADRVGQHHHLAAGGLERPCVRGHPGGRHLALEGTAERRREDADRPAPVGPRGLDQAAVAIEALRRRAAPGCAARTRRSPDGRRGWLRRRSPRARARPRSLNTSSASRSASSPTSVHHLLGAGHLRHEVLAHDAPGLDGAAAGGEQARTSSARTAGVERDRLVLQAVAGSHLADEDRRRPSARRVVRHLPYLLVCRKRIGIASTTEGRIVKLEGIHHVTCVTADAPSNADFYVRVLGLRIVKKTINQTDQTTYHIFYGDEQASYGNNISFFEYRGRPDGRAGRRQRPHDRVARRRGGSAGLLGAAPGRARASRPAAPRTRSTSATTRACATGSRSSDTTDPPLTGESPEVPGEYALQGFDGVQAYATDAGASSRVPELTTLEHGRGRRQPLGGARRGCAAAGIRSIPAPAERRRFGGGRRPARRVGLPARGHRDAGASAWSRCARTRPGSSTATSSARPTSPSPAGCCSRSPSTAAPASPSTSPTCSTWATSCSLPPWLEERRKLYEWSLTPVPTTAELRAGVAVARLRTATPAAAMARTATIAPMAASAPRRTRARSRLTVDDWIDAGLRADRPGGSAGGEDRPPVQRGSA